MLCFCYAVPRIYLVLPGRERRTDGIGPIPAELGELTALEKLLLFKNRLTGESFSGRRFCCASAFCALVDFEALVVFSGLVFPKIKILLPQQCMYVSGLSCSFVGAERLFLECRASGQDTRLDGTVGTRMCESGDMLVF